MYLESTIHTQSLELSTTQIIFCFKVEDDDDDYLNNITQHNLDLTRTIFYEVFHMVETRR